MTDTIAELGNMPSAAAFERLATAVLRASNALYANFSHPGVSAKGKPVKAPFDNVGWEQTFVGGRLVAAAHTTCELSDLRGKWLHDPATVKPRKKGAKPTQPEGDLVKAIDKIKGYRIGEPGLSMSMALTTNREVSADLLVESQTLAARENIELDVSEQVFPISDEFLTACIESFRPFIPEAKGDAHKNVQVVSHLSSLPRDLGLNSSHFKVVFI